MPYTIKEQKRLLSRNLLRNKSFISEHNTPPRQLLGYYNPQRWILVGAGPGLDFALNKITRLKQDGWRIAAVDMALWPLVQNSIEPDLIFSCEPKPFPFFSDLCRVKPVEKHNQTENIKWSAILAATIHPAQLEMLGELQIRNYSFFNWEDSKFTHPDLFALPAGGSVFNAMLSFLGGLRGATLKLVGNDWSFPGNQLYARGAIASEIHRLRQTRTWNIETFFQQVCRVSPKTASNSATTEQFRACSRWQEQYLNLLRESGHVEVEEL